MRSKRARHKADVSAEISEKHARSIKYLRIPTKPAMHSNTKPATYSDLKPASVPI